MPTPPPNSHFWANVRLANAIDTTSIRNSFIVSFFAIAIAGGAGLVKGGVWHRLVLLLLLNDANRKSVVRSALADR